MVLPPLHLRHLAAFAAVLALVLHACSAPAASPPGDVAPVPSSCVLGSGDEGEARTSDAPLVVAVAGPVDPAHAPIPHTPAERLAFAQMYETLVRVDCEGRMVAALARAWASDDGGRTWTFTLADARDWGGRTVTAAHVGESWVAAGERAPRLRALTVVDDGTLTVELPGPVDASFFAHPALAVRTTLGDDGWAIGSGPLRPEARTGASTLLLRSAAGRAVELRWGAPDAQAALAAGADLLVTSDPDALAYARAATGLRTAPLAFDRTYVLVVPGGEVASAPDAGERTSLARDAVRADARGAPGPALLCGEGSSGGPAAPARPPRVVHAADDPVARALAERWVALEGGVAASLGAQAFDAALRRSDEGAYVVALPRAPGDEADLCASLPTLARVAAVLPLIETRPTLVYRQGVTGVEVEGTGTLWLDRIGRSGPRTTGGAP